MRRLSLFLAFIAASLAFNGLAFSALAQEEMPAVSPFTPTPIENRDQELCRAFSSAWVDVFQSEKPIGETWLDLQPAFPETEIIRFPPERQTHARAYGRYGGLYDRSYFAPIDIDDDGNFETLHIEGAEMGWRYIGARLFLVEDADAYRKAWAAHEAEQSDRPFRLLDPRSDMLSAASVAALGETPKALASYGPSDVVTIFKHNGALYTASAPHHDLAHPTSASLLRLSNDRKPETVCSIDLLPSIDSVEAFIAQSAFFHAMKPIYGVPQYRCRGTMGWTADPLELPLLTLFHRPHAMAAAFERRPVIATAKADAAREVRFLAWGLDDPTSWSIYEAYKASRAGFIQQMTAYYRHFFTSSDDEAKRLAEQGYRFLADRLIYNHSSDPFHLTAVIDDAHGPFNITGESAPKDIAAAAIDALLALSPEPETGKPLSDDGLWDYSIWHDAVLAATYTRQGAERVRQLLERLEQAISQAGFRRPKDKRMENLNELFLAALGDGPLMELALSLGADVNAPTNWFQKTPLMYAAQRNDLPTTQFLLSEGADPSARTSVDRNECYQLERDGRTPLIYAAENASPGLIELLLEAGADSGAVDSMGNSVLWYLERNEQLTTDERQSLNTRLGSHH